MTELHENHFWHRRISQVAIATSFLIIIFYLLTLFGGVQFTLDASFRIGIIPAVLAGLTLGVGILSFVMSAKKPQGHLPLIVQCLLLITVSALVLSTGGLYSYFLALWVPAVIFVGVFGTRGLVVAAALPLLYAGWLAVTDIISFPIGMTTFLIGEVPVLFRYHSFFLT